MTSVAAAVAPAVQFRELSFAETERWDELVRSFPHHRVGHTRAWIESLREAGHGRPLYLVAERDGRVVGCLPGLLVDVVGLTIFGSPLPGWQTPSMGPLFDSAQIQLDELLAQLVPYLEQKHRVAHIEMLLPGLDAATMRQHGFRGESVFTYRAPLFAGDEAKTFAALTSTARRNVRRAEKLGIEIRLGLDPTFVKDHYAQLREVYLRGGNAVPFTERRLAAGVEHLQRSGLLIAASAYLPDSNVRIATSTFCIEGDELQLWMWAHRPDYRWHRSTELMTWRVMQRAIELGCRSFDLMGRGEFKRKFGAEPDETKYRWVRSSSSWLRLARPMAQRAFRVKQVVAGQVGRAGLHLERATRSLRTTRRRASHACVLGDIDLVRALGLARVPSAVVAPPRAPSRYSRHTRTALKWIDPFTFPEALVDALVRYGSAQDVPPTLFFQDDASLLLVSRHRERLANVFRFILPDASLIEQLVDKAKFQALARKLNLPVPTAVPLDPATDPVPPTLPFDGPFVVKPRMRRPESWAPIAGESKALLVESAAALNALWSDLARARLPLLAQEFVAGPESAIESYHVYVDGSGTRIAEFTGRKLRTYPAVFGDSSALEISDAPQLSEIGRDLTQRLGLRGVAKFDFKRRPDGSFALLEVNPRFTLWHHPAALAGVNIPALVHADLTGVARATNAARARSGVRWCKVWTDHAAARAEGMTFGTWLAWAMRCEAKRAIAWGDPLPLLESAVRSAMHRILSGTDSAVGVRP